MFTQFMRNINADYLELGGGKTAFRKLLEAQRLNCDITDLELSNDNIDYEKIK